MIPPSAKLAGVILVALVMSVLVLCHVHGVNGPWYWIWSWRRLSWWIYPAMTATALAPFALAQWAYLKNRLKLALVLLATTTFALQLVALAFQPPVGLHRLVDIVQSATNTSYWIDATILNAQSEDIPFSQILLQYPEIVPLMHLHAKYKPPGLMLYYVPFVKLLGHHEASAWAGGLGVLLMAAGAVPACFWFLRTYGCDRAAAFAGASFFSLCPSLVLFAPQFDQVYPMLACVILVLWHIASRSGTSNTRLACAAVGCGVMLALALFCSYIFLILGCFIMVDWLLILSDRGQDDFYRAAGAGLVAVATVLVLYGLLFLATGFDPIETFHSISRTQAKDLIPLIRPFPRHIFFDVLDFALGSGWISFLLLFFLLIAMRSRLFTDRAPQSRLVLVALIQIVTVALAALLPGETARLWLIQFPFLMAPIGIELARWPARHRYVAYGCLLLLLIVLAQNMTFIYMGPELDGPRW